MICEKPLTATLEDAIALTELAEKSGRFVGVTYTYSGYPLAQEARAMVARGDLGDIRVVQVEYPLEWMATGIELEGNQQAAWRTDPKRNGRGGSIGDIGTHAYHLAGYVTGLEAEAIAADLATFVPGRALDDNAHVMIRYVGGARGLLWSSQVAIGRSNGLRLRVSARRVASSGARSIRTSSSSRRSSAHRRRSSAVARISTDATRARVRTPPGHPEGYIEAFANLYAGFAEAIGREPRAVHPERWPMACPRPGTG